jgi:hypothetical protein
MNTLLLYLAQTNSLRYQAQTVIGGNTMQLTEQKKIILLSDGQLYRDAVSFVSKQNPLRETQVTKSQLSGLENIVRSHSFAQILGYINHQLGRDTLNDDLREFYQNLLPYLEGLPSMVEEHKFVSIPENPSRAARRELREKIDQYAYLMAKEFIQHLVAENNYQRSLSNA